MTLLVVFKYGVPLVLASMMAGTIYSFSTADFGASEVLFAFFAGLVFFLIGREFVRLVVIHLDCDELHVSTCCRVRVFPLLELNEVCVRYRGAFPYAEFRFSPREGDGVLSFHTILQPKLEYMSTQQLSDLSLLEGVPIRYSFRWGKEKLVVDGREVDGES